MLEPQSTALFIVLIAVFSVLMWRTLAAGHVAFRVLAACLAFVPAMAFGVLAVNKYYGYYQTWGSVVADLAHQNASAASQVPQVEFAARSRAGTLDGSRAHLTQAERQGYLVRLMLTGQRSHLTRAVYVYLPPQYFQPAYQAYRFPVIELIHGQPGEAQDWVSVVGVTRDLGHLLADKRARPAVLVMPDANGGDQVSLQCLNQVAGPQDLTYLAVDLPGQLARTLRVRRPGPGWGVAGYSEGGYCAANMALRFPRGYGAAGVLSGYFAPFDNRLSATGPLVSPFGGSNRLREQNTPLDELEALSAATTVPRFWLGAGAADGQAVTDAETFRAALLPRQGSVPLTLTPGGGHTMTTWRAELPSMLSWMTLRLAPPARPADTSTLAARHRPEFRDRGYKPAKSGRSRPTVIQSRPPR
jgi:enterochelin esterase-like enzyme